MKYVDLILPLPIPRLYTYEVPYSLLSESAIGKRVTVQFGKKKIYTGLIHKIHGNKPDYETKKIISVLDIEPIISDLQFKFWDWISEYYMSSYGDIFKAALPAGFKLESETVVKLVEKSDNDNDLSEKEEAVIDLLYDKKTCSINELEKEFDFNVLLSVKKLIDKNIIYTEEKVRNKYKPKTEKFISLSPQLDSDKAIAEALSVLKRAKKQTELLMNFIYITKYGSDKHGGLIPSPEIKKGDLLLHAETSTATLKSLLEKGYLIQTEKQIDRIAKYAKDETVNKQLNEYQIKAKSEIKSAFTEKDIVLLHGVTSSGKTEVYIDLIKEQVKKGKQVLYLLPEIALTAQIINRLKDIFGKDVGVYHSKFNDAERIEIWKNLQENNSQKSYKIILGVRSSVFLPFKNLGLIIIDEEHENTYKQYDPAPRYNARDASMVLAKLHNAKVLLGTATPAIESYFNAKTGKYGLVEIVNRYKDIQMPEILVADVKEARRKKQMKSLFTPLLHDSIKNALENNEQVILFQNRRGFSPYVECETCGWIPKCENCDVSLTYHKYTNHVVCHYCGYSYQAPKQCKACGAQAMTTRGFGTEKIEDEIKVLFPEAKTARMDFDSTRSKKAYHELIYNFENKNTDILIGTQMVSKGLDFDNVSVVGIMNADNMLNFPDFRAFERSFQLMAQVSGRAGRKNKRGKVIIQTTDIKHSVVKDVISNDYHNLFNMQLLDRQQFHYPPYFRLIQIGIKFKDSRVIDYTAKNTAQQLKTIFGSRVLGPEYPPVSRIKNWYIKNILIKIERTKSVYKAKRLIEKVVENIKEDSKSKYVQFVFNVDPM